MKPNSNRLKLLIGLKYINLLPLSLFGMKKHYTTIAIIITNTIVLFLLLNLIAYFIPSPSKKNKLEESYFSPNDLAKENPNILQEIHEGRPIKEIIELYNENPNVKSHPVLEFMTIPCNGKFYNVGFENARYNSFVNSTNIKSKINNGIWLFGGSTMFGTGVTDNETIAYFLNKIDTNNSYINLGVPGYRQRNEIEKLILLLQKGYKPKQIIFLDGLNDLYTNSGSNFNALETPSRGFNAYAHNFNFGFTGLSFNLVYAFPIVKLYYEYLAYYMIKNKTISAENLGKVYEEDALYNTKSYLHYKLGEVNSNLDKGMYLGNKNLQNYYQSNIILLNALSKSYQFDYKIFLQPIGPHLSTNSFIKDSITFKNNFHLYLNVKPVYEGLKEMAKSNEFPNLYDISDSHLDCKNPYIDLTHYSKSMNKKLAEIILQKRN